MNKLAVLLATLVTVVGCQQIDNQKISVKDPSGQIEVKFQVQEGKALYAVAFNEKEIIKDSPLGFAFTNMPAIGDSLKLLITNGDIFLIHGKCHGEKNLMWKTNTTS